MLKMQVIGNLGKDCVVNTVNGMNVINFTVAHTEKFKDKQGVNQERTTWVECAYWTDRTAIAPYLVKGQLIFAEGNPEVKSFTRNDGSPGSSLNMRVREVQLLGGRKNENTVGGQQYESNTNTATRLNESAPVGTDEVSDDLPF